jgi:prepilin-type N-terminal cleavage/methylation domain-containing protein
MKSPKTQNAGFTLIEVLIGTAIASFILVGVSLMFRSQLEASIANQDETELQASIQATANLIMQDIVMAGFGKVTAQPIQHTNVSGTAVGGDTLTLLSASQGGNAITTFAYAGAVGVSGTEIFLRCYGVDNQGGVADPTRDAILLPGQTLQLYFVDPFTGLQITGITNPQTVIAAEVNPDGTCLTNQPYDYDNQTIGGSANDPVVKVTLSPGLTSPVGRGSTVYGLRGASPAIVYSLDTANKTLNQNGVPILLGVEDFQVQFRVEGEAAWRDTLAGVDTTKLAEVAFAILVKTGTSTTLGKEYQNSFTIFDHTIDVSADLTGIRKRHEFRVRTKNVAL